MRRVVLFCSIVMASAAVGCGDESRVPTEDAGAGFDAARGDAGATDSGSRSDGDVMPVDGGGGRDGSVAVDAGRPDGGGSDAGATCGDRGMVCTPASCCAPLVCMPAPGRPATCGDACAPVGGSCTTMPCCGALACLPDPFGGGTCADMPACGASGAGCRAATDCCAGLSCIGSPRGGTCAPADCRLRSDVCDDAHPCCPGGVCTSMGMLSFCVDDPSMCTPAFTPCGAGLPGCCVGTTCVSDPFGGGSCQPDGACGVAGADCSFTPCCPGLPCVGDPSGRVTCGGGGVCPVGTPCDPLAPCCDRGLACLADPSGAFTCQGGAACGVDGEICIDRPCCPGLSCIPRGPTLFCSRAVPPPIPF